MVENLLRLGFIKIGYWHLKNNSLNYQLLDDPGIISCLYAFVNREEVLYLGMTYTDLKTRINLYWKTYGSSGSTNRNINSYLTTMLKANETKQIDIFYLKEDSKIIEYEGIKLSLVGGLEYPLICLTEARWNIKGNKKIIIPKDAQPVKIKPERVNRHEASFLYNNVEYKLKKKDNGGYELVDVDGQIMRVKMVGFLSKLNNDLNLELQLVGHTNRDARMVIKKINEKT